MSGASDPLASPTLAQLYLGQGKFDRAREVIDKLLDEDPLAGAALALRRRLDTREQAALAVRRDGNTLHASYVHGLAKGEAKHAHVILTVYANDADGRPSQRVTSQRAVPQRGERTFSLPTAAGPASAVACLARLDDGHLRVLAVSSAHSW